MKKIIPSAGLTKISRYFLVIASLLIASTTYAMSTSEQLSKEIDQYTDAIKKYNGENLIASADEISGAGLNNTQLFDEVEKRLIQQHQAQLVDRKDQLLARQVSALTRTLASSGNYKYKASIDQIFRETRSNGVKRRAKRMKNKFDWYAKRNSIMQNMSQHIEGQDLMTTRLLNLINKEDNLLRRYGAEELSRQSHAEAAILQVIAERLENEHIDPQDNLHLDTLAWFCRILGQFAKEEYRPLLQGIADNKELRKKLRKYAKKALRS